MTSVTWGAIWGLVCVAPFPEDCAAQRVALSNKHEAEIAAIIRMYFGLNFDVKFDVNLDVHFNAEFKERFTTRFKANFDVFRFTEFPANTLILASTSEQRCGHPPQHCSKCT